MSDFEIIKCLDQAKDLEGSGRVLQRLNCIARRTITSWRAFGRPFPVQLLCAVRVICSPDLEGRHLVGIATWDSHPVICSGARGRLLAVQLLKSAKKQSIFSILALDGT